MQNPNDGGGGGTVTKDTDGASRGSNGIEIKCETKSNVSSLHTSTTNSTVSKMTEDLSSLPNDLRLKTELEIETKILRAKKKALKRRRRSDA